MIDFKPEGFHTITPYLIVRDARRLIEFAKQAFDAAELGVYNNPDGKIAHAAIRIGDSIIEISDGNEQFPSMTSALHIYVPDVDAVYRKALNAGATSLSEPSDQFYGDRNGNVVDPVGNHWYIATRKEVLTEEEMMRRASK